MRILFLTPQLPYPPRQGTAMRNWGLIKNVARNHEVWLLSFSEQAQAPHPLLRETCLRLETVPTPAHSGRDRVRALVTTPLPDMAWRLWSDEFNRKLLSMLATADIDVLQVEGIELARYALENKDRIVQRQCSIVFDNHNCEYLLQKRNFERDSRKPERMHAAAYSLVQTRRLAHFERAMMQASHATLCVSPEDQVALRALDPAIEPAVVPNGIDVADYFNHPAQGAGSPPTLIFTGKMDYRPNIEAALWFGVHVFPRVRAAVPDARWRIVGQKPHERLAPIKGAPGVEITGAVDDIRGHIAAADVYVAPLLAGGGTRFKLLEAMSMRKPIVSTSLGAEGFDVTSGEQMALADTAEAFANRVVELLRAPAARARMGDRALAYVREHFDWSVIVPALERVYGTL